MAGWGSKGFMYPTYTENGVRYYKPALLREWVEGPNRRSTPQYCWPKPTPEPVPRPNDFNSFDRMFKSWMVDYYRRQARPAKPGPASTTLTAGFLVSKRIATYGDRTTGILETDHLGKEHFLSRALNHDSGPDYENNPKGKEIAEWLVEDYSNKEEELKRWWDDEGNSLDALVFQGQLWVDFRALLDHIRQDTRAFQITQMILAVPFQKFGFDGANMSAMEQRINEMQFQMQFRDVAAMASDPVQGGASDG